MKIGIEDIKEALVVVGIAALTMVILGFEVQYNRKDRWGDVLSGWYKVQCDGDYSLRHFEKEYLEKSLYTRYSPEAVSYIYQYLDAKDLTSCSAQEFCNRLNDKFYRKSLYKTLRKEMSIFGYPLTYKQFEKNLNEGWRSVPAEKRKHERYIRKISRQNRGI